MWKPNFEMNSLLTPALYVESGVKGMCLDNRNPSDGNAYLRMVIAERAQCEETVTANIDLEKIGNQHIYVEEPPNIPTLPEYLRPTMEFQNFQIADFSNLRQLVSRLTKVAHLQKWKSPEGVTVPNIEHSDNQIWSGFFKNTEPELKLLVSMSQPVLEHCLEVLIEALDEVPEGNGIGMQCGRWLYSVLACLKLPLDAETCSLLRDLARRCGEIRSHIALDSQNVSELIMPLNVMICLVARYFRQNDLAD